MGEVRIFVAVATTMVLLLVRFSPAVAEELHATQYDGTTDGSGDDPDLYEELTAADEAHKRWDYPEAIRITSKILEKHPNLVAALSERALLYARTGELDRAMTDASRAIQLDPKWADAYAVRAIAFTHLGDLDKAIADLSETICLSPEDAFDIGMRGDLYLQKQQPDNAMADYNRALEIDPDSTPSLCRRGKLHAALGHYEAAASDYLHSQEVDPNYPPSYLYYAFMLATCYDAGVRNPAKAVEYAKIGLELNPKREDGWEVYGAALAAAGRFDEAIEWEQRVADSKGMTETERAHARSLIGLFKSHQPLVQPYPGDSSPMPPSTSSPPNNVSRVREPVPPKLEARSSPDSIADDVASKIDEDSP